jgi:hypothetical protein
MVENDELDEAQEPEATEEVKRADEISPEE